MKRDLVLVYGDEFLRYNFGDDHPLSQVRVKLAIQLMEHLGLIAEPDVTVVPPIRATRDDVLLFHDAQYLDFVAARSEAGGWLDETQDTPAFAGALEAALDVVGGALRAAELVMSGQANHSFHMGGGLHHAHSSRASGFCILNDVAVAIAWLKRHGLNRIMYVDIDAHQGDGVMYGYYTDPAVLNVDFHEDGKYLFPGRGDILELGEGPGLNLKVNLPFPPHSADNSYSYAFRELVPALARSYQPEIILMQCGVDTHAGDPLTHMHLSVNSQVAAVQLVHRIAHEQCDGRLVLFGGGGYDPGAVAVGWSGMVSALTGAIVPRIIPEHWRTLFRETTGKEAPRNLVEGTIEDTHFREIWSKVAFLKRRLGIE